jgi:D-aspartate ligase
MKIFVIHARRTGYGVIRALKSYTKEIYVADTFLTPIFRSKYVKKSFLIKDITQVDEQVFLKEMIQLAEFMDYSKEKPVVFTGKDDYLLFFAKNSAILKKYFDYSFESDYSILESILNKITLVNYAREANVPIPKTFTNIDDIDAILDAADFPLVVKPAIKNRPDIDVVSAAFRIKTCLSREDLLDAIAVLRRTGQPYVVQEYIAGDDSELYTVGSYSYEGSVKAWSVSKKIRQFPPGTGECAYGTTIGETELLSSAAKFLHVTKYTGISQIEFKKNNGKYYLIEMNPRVWSWHQIHVKVGVNFCKIAVDHVRGIIYNRAIAPSSESKYWMFLTMDILHNCLLNKNESFFKVFRNLLGCDVEAFLCVFDPMPFFCHLRRTIPYMRREMTAVRKQKNHK